MAIEKYAAISLYGFGFLGKRGDQVYFIENGQHRNLEIIVKDVLREFDTGMFRIRRNGKELGKDMPGEVIHAVYENGAWKEYFTGAALKILDDEEVERNFAYLNGIYGRIGFKTDESAAEFGNSIMSFEETGDHLNCLDDIVHMGLRELVCVKSSILELTPKQFSDSIAAYSEPEIKGMVSQFYDLQEKAVKWGDRFEKEVRDMFREGNYKASSLVLDLESRFGAYAKTNRTYGVDKEKKEVRLVEGTENGGKGKGQLSEESIQHMLDMMGEKDTPQARASLMEKLEKGDASDILFDKLRSNRETGAVKKQSLHIGKEENKTTIIIMLVVIILILIVICVMK